MDEKPIAGSPAESLGIIGGNTLGAIAGFDNYSTDPALGLARSILDGTAGFAPTASNGFGLGRGFGDFGSFGSITGDAATVLSARS